jgi:hypothetical protein
LIHWLQINDRASVDANAQLCEDTLGNVNKKTVYFLEMLRIAFLHTRVGCPGASDSEALLSA